MNVSQVSIGKLSFGQIVFDQKTLNQTEAELNRFFSARILLFTKVRVRCVQISKNKSKLCHSVPLCHRHSNFFGCLPG
jgi:hypothetical protein